MITIRAAQLVALRSAAREELLRRLLDHVREFFPAAAGATDGELLETLRTAATRAGELGLTSDRDVAIYVDVQFAIGAPPESREWGAAILDDVGIPAAHRAHLLLMNAAERLERGDV